MMLRVKKKTKNNKNIFLWCYFKETGRKRAVTIIRLKVLLLKEVRREVIDVADLNSQSVKVAVPGLVPGLVGEDCLDNRAHLFQQDLIDLATGEAQGIYNRGDNRIILALQQR